MFMFCLIAKADKIYNVIVTIRVTYEYMDGASTVGEQSGSNETQVIEVCASSPHEAREKAIYQCQSMCQSSQDMGTATYGGKKCRKYKKREVYNAEPKATTIDC